MLKVIGAGLPRTGTLSLKMALERLGFGPCYHMFEIFEHLELIDRWLPGIPDTPAGWERVFAGYRSTVDWPASFFWRQQAEAFPQAKVVLTVRDPARWYASFRELIKLRAASAEADHASEAALSFQAEFARLQPLLKHIVHATFGEDLDFPARLPSQEQAVAAFHRHVAAVREAMSPDRLLVFDVRQGWAPLCDFLGVAAPAGEPFPRLNDIEAVKRKLEELGRAGP
jgi:Sulfotransferase domain